MNQKQNSLLFEIEQEVAKLLLTKLEKLNITLEKASQISEFILAHLPENLNDEQIRQIIPSLDDEFVELSSIVYKHLTEYEQKYKEEKIKNIRELLQREDFKQTDNQVTDYLNGKLNL